jgi:hypothetical protein
MSDAPIFTRGDRVRDRTTGHLGTYQGIVHLPSSVPNGGSSIRASVLWDGADNALPLHPNQTIEHVEVAR